MKIFSPHKFFGAAAIALALPLIGQSAALSVNGTCVSGSCSSPDSISNGSISGTIPYTLTLANGDVYGVSVAYTDSYTPTAGSAVTVNPTVTYLGSSPSKADSVALVFYQNFFDDSPGTFDGTYTETIPFQLATGTTANGQLFVDGQGIGLVSATGPGNTTQSLSANLTGLDGDTLSYAYDFNFNFAAGDVTGTGGGSTSPSAVPEPAQAIPAALSLGGFALVAFRRRKLLNNR